MEKGTYGYIDKIKKANTIKTILMFTTIIIIFIVGYLLNDNSKQNVFTIIAVLLVLPASRVLVNTIIIFPYKSELKERYVEINKLIKGNTILCDLAISSREKVVYLPFLIIAKDTIYTYTNNEKKKTYILDYLTKSLKNQGYDYKLTVYSDYNMLVKSLKGFRDNEDNDIEEVKKHILSLSV